MDLKSWKREMKLGQLCLSSGIKSTHQVYNFCLRAPECRRLPPLHIYGVHGRTCFKQFCFEIKCFFPVSVARQMSGNTVDCGPNPVVAKWVEVVDNSWGCHEASNWLRNYVTWSLIGWLYIFRGLPQSQRAASKTLK